MKTEQMTTAIANLIAEMPTVEYVGPTNTDISRAGGFQFEFDARGVTYTVRVSGGAA